MRGLWSALLFCFFCLSAQAQEEDPLRLQVNEPSTLTVSKANGLSLHWEGETSPGLLWSLTILADEERVLRLLAADGSQSNRMGWRPDLDARPGHLMIRLDELWLAPGKYTLLVELPDGHSPSLALWITESTAQDSREVTVEAPMDVSRISGWRQSRDQGHHAYTWWPVLAPGRAVMELSESEWMLQTDGSGDPSGARVALGENQVRISSRDEASAPPSLSRERDQWLWTLVTPLCLLLATIGAIELWRGREIEGLQGALVLSIGIGLALTEPVLTDPGAYLLDSGDQESPVVESVAQLALMSSAFEHGSAQGDVFRWPEGSPWLSGDSSWMSYLAPALIARATDPVTAHNLSMGLGISLLCFFTWALLRTLGASKFGSLMGAVASTLSPAVLDGIDQRGLDQASLFLVPLFFLQLHKALRRAGWWSPVVAGSALAAITYCHQEFGTFMLVCAPFMILWRLPGAGFRLRLARAGVLLGTTMALQLPSIFMGQMEQNLAIDQAPEMHLVDSETNLWRPFEDQTSRLRLSQSTGIDQASELGPSSPPMERLAAAITHSVRWREIVEPTHLLAAGGLYWPLTLLAVAVARRRIIAAVALADTALMLLCSLGPFLLMSVGGIGPALPYYLAWLWLPGVESQIDVRQYAVLAAVIAPIPIALAVEGAMEHGSRLWSRVLHFSRLRLLGARARLSPALLINRLMEPFIWQLKYAPHGPILLFLLAFAAGLGLATERSSMGPGSNSSGIAHASGETWVAPWPEIRQISRHPGLQGVPPGTALALPVMEHTQPQLYLPLIRAGIQLVNPGPMASSRVSSSQWIDQNPLLNQLVQVSGSDGAQAFLSYDPSQVSLHSEELVQNGLDYIIMFRPQMPSAEIALETEHTLDQLYPRVRDDGRLAIWNIRSVQDLP
jgi:hypothetical protein